MSILSKNTTIGGHKPLLNDTALQALVTSLGLGETTDEGVLAAAISAITNKKATDTSLGSIKLSTGNSSNNANDTGEAVAYKVINQSSINLNNFITEGNYTIKYTSSCNNFPSVLGTSTSYTYHLTVLRMSGSNTVFQVMTRNGTLDIAIRYENSGSWSSWHKLINSNNLNSTVTKVNNKEVLTAYGSTIRTVQSNFNNCKSLGIGMCGSNNAPNNQCSEWGFINLPSSRSGSTNSNSIIQIAWLCGNHTSYPTFYYRYYNGSSSSTSWSSWNPVGHLAT